MAKVIEIPYKPREAAMPFHESHRRWRVLIIHRRFGKTVAAINHLIRQATQDPQVLADQRGLKYDVRKLMEWRKTPRLFAYIAPFYNQAKSIAWDMLKYYSAPIPGIAINESELRIDYPGGGRIRLFGNDNPNTHRGLKFWECVMDEFQDHNPFTWQEVILPACFDTQAPITFIGTIRGKDHLWKQWNEHKEDPDWFTLYLPASVSGILDNDFLQKERKIMGENKFLQEYELEPGAVIQGSIYGDLVIEARKEKRLTSVQYEKFLPVDTTWDLGMDDSTAIIFSQTVSGEKRIIDYLEMSGVGLDVYVRKLLDKKYIYGVHWLPPDVAVRELTTGRSRLEVLQGLLKGHDIRIVPRIGGRDKIEVEEGINAGRMMFPNVWIDETKCAKLIECLEHYRREWDEDLQVFKPKPIHDWASHAADAYRYLAAVSRITQDELSSRREDVKVDTTDPYRDSDSLIPW